MGLLEMIKKKLVIRDELKVSDESELIKDLEE